MSQPDQHIAIIGGTGAALLWSPGDPDTINTPYGEAVFYRLQIAGQETIFLARHGIGRVVPPHRVNYRANIWALHALGIRQVLATQAVGSLNAHMKPGHFVLVSQFIDWTKGRPSTFFDGDDGHLVHVDVTYPYCPYVTMRLLRAGEFLNQFLHSEAVYACTEGPRFETAAEINALRVLGADVVGMTNVPEAVLAREAGLCYASVCIICNWAAGISENPLTQDEVVGVMRDRATDLRGIIEHFVAMPAEGHCRCHELGFSDLLPVLPAKA